MAFSIGNTTKNQQVLTTSGSVTISLSAGSVVLISFITLRSSGSPSTGTSVTSSNLTFAKRMAKTYTDISGGTVVEVEEWWAYSSGALTNEVITVNLSLAPNVNDGAVILATECVGLPNPSSPWDGNGSLPDMAFGNGGIPALTGLSTNGSADVGLYHSFSSFQGTSTPASPGTWTSANGGSGSGTTAPRIQLFYQQLSAVQNNATWSSGSTTGANWGVSGDAFGPGSASLPGNPVGWAESDY